MSRARCLIPLVLTLAACRAPQETARSQDASGRAEPVPSEPEDVAATPPPNLPPRAAAMANGSPPAHQNAAPQELLPAPQPAAAPAPYDLAHDLRARSDYAKQKLGRGTLTAILDSYVVVAPPGWTQAELQTSVSLMQNAMTAFYTGRFDKKPERAITVYLFPRAQPYNAFCKSEFNEYPCMSIYGFYQPGNRAMVMNAGLGLGTLTHELVHPLVEADFNDAPTWLNEGIASVFEAPVIPRKGEIHGAKNWRYPILREAMRRDSGHVKLSTLFHISDEEFRGANEGRNYALARYVCQWMDSQGKLWAFYHAFRDGYADDHKGLVAFHNVMEKPPEQLDAAFERWLLAL